MTKVNVSVIMPSLNVVDYIEQCLTSVMNQSMENIEIICVDGGSTDGTLEIIQKYADSDQRIRVVQADRKSYGYQVNLGLQYATGEYVGIVETDDYVAPNMFARLYHVASTQQLDYVKADFYEVGYGLTYPIHFAKLEKYYGKVLTGENRDVIFSFWVTNWCGIYNRDFLERNRILHNETLGASYQDTGFLVQVMSFAQRCQYISDKLYYYRVDNPGSSVKSRGKMMLMMGEHEYIREILLAHKKEHELQLDNYYRMLGHRMTFNRIEDRLRDEYIEVILKDYKDLKQNIAFPQEVSGDVIQWIRDIESEPKTFLQRYRECRNRICDILGDENVYLYGAGRYARILCRWLLENESEIYEKIKGILVTNTDNLEKSYFMNLPVYAIDQVDMTADMKIVLALKQGTRAYCDVEEELRHRGITNYCNIQWWMDWL